MFKVGDIVMVKHLRTPDSLGTIAALGLTYNGRTTYQVKDRATGFYTVEFEHDLYFVAPPKTLPPPSLTVAMDWVSPLPAVVAIPSNCQIVKNSCLNKDFLYCKTHDEEADNGVYCRKPAK